MDEDNIIVSIPQQGYPLCGVCLLGHRTRKVDVSIPQQGYPLCGLCTLWYTSCGWDGFNTAIGYPPMRHVQQHRVDRAAMLQYRNRVSPHAAGRTRYKPATVASFNTAIGYHPCGWYDLVVPLLLTRRFNTAAGLPPLRRWFYVPEKNSAYEFQYRSRVTTFAALKFKVYFNIAGEFQYRSKVNPFSASLETKRF